jgi:hypothetical protein
MDEREHLRVHDAGARGEPLDVTVAEASGGSEGVGVIDVPGAGDGDGLEAAVGMRGEARHRLAVVHTEAVFAREIRAHVAARPRARGRCHRVIPGRIGILVVRTEQERVPGAPRETEG